MSDEARVLETIDMLLFRDYQKTAWAESEQHPWKGETRELEPLLSTLAREYNLTTRLNRALWHNQALSQGLGKLSKTHPNRVEKRTKHGGINIWVIKPPGSYQLELK